MKVRDSRDSLNIRDILAVFWKRKWLIVIPLIMVVAVAFGGSYLITPEYESWTIIQIDPQLPLTTEIQRLVGQQPGLQRLSVAEKQSQLNSIFNYLTSSSYTAALNERLQLDREPDIDKQARAFVQRQPNITLEQARLNVLQSRLKKDIRLSWAANDQVKITAGSTDPVKARNIANALGEIFIAGKVKQELAQIRSSQDFSDIQLEKYERQLTDKLADKTALEKEFLAVQLGESIASEANRADISHEIDRTTTEINDLREEERTILNQLMTVEGLSVDRLTLNDSDEKAQKRRELRQEMQEIGELIVKYTWDSPQMLNYHGRVNNILTAIETENQRLVQRQYADADQQTQRLLVELFNIRTSLDYLSTNRPFVQAAMDELTARINLVPEYEARLAQLDREISATTDLRDRFQRQQESSTISQALIQDASLSSNRVVEPAKLSLSPTKPNRGKIVILGVILGLMIGGAVAFLVELLDSSFKKPDEVEEVMGLPVLGIAPRIDFLKKVAR
ncbi:MAG TPA: Wzz/FepE/Etk N-terminal domain-containing protein [Acidobacteriota bacterium]|nr:Wzz/FepE/Etk N-terminal domain-containing protein [Acidobacteriota bacterium]